MRQLFIAALLLSTNLLFAQKQDIEKVLTELHWIVERSHIDTVALKIDKACEQYNFATTTLKIEDGKYQGETPLDDYKYKHVISFEVKNGKIISLDYDEINKDGQGKQHDKVYCKKMDVAGTNPSIAYPIYEKAMLDKQNLNSIDAVSGASYSLYRFKLAFWNALKNANKL